MPDVDFLQFLNLFLAMQGVVAILVFSRYLLDRWPHWYEEQAARLAIGFVFFFAGFTLFRFWFWFIRLAEQNGLYIPPAPGSILFRLRPVFLLGSIVMTWGLICVLREISVWKSKLGWTALMVTIAILSGLLAFGWYLPMVVVAVIASFVAWFT